MQTRYIVTFKASPIRFTVTVHAPNPEAAVVYAKSMLADLGGPNWLVTVRKSKI